MLPANFSKPNLTWGSHSQLYFSVRAVVIEHISIWLQPPIHMANAAPLSQHLHHDPLTLAPPALFCLYAHWNTVAKIVLPQVLTLWPNQSSLQGCRELRHWARGRDTRLGMGLGLPDLDRTQVRARTKSQLLHREPCPSSYSFFSNTENSIFVHKFNDPSGLPHFCDISHWELRIWFP